MVKLTVKYFEHSLRDYQFGGLYYLAEIFRKEEGVAIEES